jgi:DNA-binding response OmpR family regulator
MNNYEGDRCMAKILIVDDDEDFVTAVALVLQKNGFEISTADSLTKGMENFETFHPDLVLLDVIMEQPDDGFVMAQTLKKRDSSVPILMLTSIGQVTGMDFGKDEEFVPVDDFIQKPIMPNKLLEKINLLLNK